MNIELSEKQYKDLMEVVFLGNWLANATRTGAKGDERIEKFEKIQGYILSQAKNFKAEQLVSYQSGEYYPTNDFEESLMTIVEAYDEHTFWEELPLRLAERDLLKEIGPVSKLTEKHRERKYEIAEIYENEFAKNRLKNLTIQKSVKNNK